MLEQIGRFIGMAAADVVNLVRNRPQVVPCTVDWTDPVQSRYFSAEPQRLMDEECCNLCEHGCFSE